jgi:hypothetical protein
MQGFPLLLTQQVAYLGPADNGNGLLTSSLGVSISRLLDLTLKLVCVMDC